MQTALDLGQAYLVTIGWAIVGSFSMGLGIIITLKLFAWSTGSVDEWGEIKRGNMAMATVIAAVVIALGIVVAFVTKT